jgi:hypothetical protein
MQPALTSLVFALVGILAGSNMIAAEKPAGKGRPVGVPADAQLHQGKWYLAYPGSEPWAVANEKCKNLGGSLAIVDNEKTQDFLTVIGNGRIFWLGATSNSGGEWKWVDGTKMTYTNWLKGQPSNAKNHEHWLAMGKNGKWFDIGQKSPLVQGFICEWKAK